MPVDLAGLDDDVLEDVEIVVGSWGCNVLDDALLARMPKLRLARVCRGHGEDDGHARDVRARRVVSSAAAANAVPVAEFTFAAIVMIAKDVFRVRDRHREVRGRTPIHRSGRRTRSARGA